MKIESILSYATRLVFLGATAAIALAFYKKHLEK